MRTLAAAVAAAGIAVAVLCTATPARANPLSLARFGGLRGDAVHTGAYALYWNPAALAEPGWDTGLDLELIARQASYDRDADLNYVPDAARAANSGLATITTVGVVPSLFGRWGLRLGGFDVGLGLGVFVENGGSANWDKNLRAPTEYPGAIDGPQRWSSISAQLLLVDIGVGLGLRHRATGLSLGFSPLLVVGNFSTVRARNIDQSEDLVDASGNPKEGRAYFDGSGVGFSAVVGARWDIAPGWAVGATYQRGARVGLAGDLRVAFGTQAASTQKATLQLPIADTVRVAAALRATRWLTLRPSLEIAIWSVLKEHVFAAADGTPLFVIPRSSRDMLAARLRADARVNDRWRLMLGLGVERGPTPASAMEPGFGERSNVEVGAGAIFALSHHVDLSATFLFQYFMPVTVENSIQRPTANGTYRDQREVLLVDVEVHGWRPTVR
jgi:long-chain fatty acid transport protein